MKKKVLLVLLIPLAWYVISVLIGCHDYRRDTRHFFCLEDGRCVTMWRTLNGVCYVIPGKYSGKEDPPVSESYVMSPFTKSMDIIWEKNTTDIIVYLEDDKKQIIHESLNGVKVFNYNLNKRYNDSVFFYFDGKYDRYKKDVDFMHIDIKEEYASGSSVVSDNK